jgi:hypothetical protein
MLSAPDGSGYPTGIQPSISWHGAGDQRKPVEALEMLILARGVKADSGIRHPFINFIGMIEISFRRHNYYPYICTQFNYKLQP